MLFLSTVCVCVFLKRFEVNAPQLTNSDIVPSASMVLCILSTALPVTQPTVYVR